MGNIVIIGNGGFAAELTMYFSENAAADPEWTHAIKGYLSHSPENNEKYGLSAPYLGREVDYQPDDNDLFLIAIGLPDVRAKVISYLASRENFSFFTFVHHTSVVASSARLGTGSIVAPFCRIGPNAQIGMHNVVNYHSAIAHDCVVGESNVLSPSVQVCGWVKIGRDNLFGAGVAAVPRVAIGDGNRIQAGVTLLSRVGSGKLVVAPATSKVFTLPPDDD